LTVHVSVSLMSLGCEWRWPGLSTNLSH